MLVFVGTGRQRTDGVLVEIGAHWLSSTIRPSHRCADGGQPDGPGTGHRLAKACVAPKPTIRLAGSVEDPRPFQGASRSEAEGARSSCSAPGSVRSSR